MKVSTKLLVEVQLAIVQDDRLYAIMNLGRGEVN